jgi:branched-chain amino acid transport system substrate-binding protein
VDDPYGEPFAELVRRELAIQGAPVPDLIDFDPKQSDYSAVAQRIVDSGAATIGIIGDSDAGPRLVQALAEVIDPTVQTSIWMNDAMRVPATASIYRRLDDAVLATMRGVSPRSSIPDAAVARTFPEGGRLFAANAYDCMTVIALAAEQSEFINGESMAQQIVPTTTGGTPCTSFPSCMAQIDAGRGIDYDGPTSGLDLAADGDPMAGTFDVFRFDGGLDVTDASSPALRVTG